jgi:RHS repeat-associated protein
MVPHTKCLNARTDPFFQTLQGAGGVGGLVCVFQGGAGSPSTPFFPAYDANGNITEYVSTNGTVAAHYEYDPYGNITTASGLKSNAFSHRFSTKPFEAETGLTHYQFRSYSSALGRWLSKDSIEEDGGLNLYAFCENNPIDLIDPLGDTAGEVCRMVLVAAAVIEYAPVIIGGIIIGYIAVEIAPAVWDWVCEMNGERNWDRKNPNPDKPKTRHPQTGKKLPPKAPPKTPPPLPPLCK